jgi:hypothetical protein
MFVGGVVTVFTSRFRCAYLKKRSKKAMALIPLVLLIAVIFGVAGRHDEQDQQRLKADFSPALRNNVVASWETPSGAGSFPATTPNSVKSAFQYQGGAQ